MTFGTIFPIVLRARSADGDVTMMSHLSWSADDCYIVAPCGGHRYYNVTTWRILLLLKLILRYAAPHWHEAYHIYLFVFMK